MYCVGLFIYLFIYLFSHSFSHSLVHSFWTGKTCPFILNKINLKAEGREFPGSPVVRTPCFHC